MPESVSIGVASLNVSANAIQMLIATIHQNSVIVPSRLAATSDQMAALVARIGIACPTCAGA